MRKFIKKTATSIIGAGLLSAGLLLASSNAMASGYQVVLQGSRVTGMGNCAVGFRSGAPSLFFNPGAMAMEENSSVMLGANFVSSSVQYAGTNSTYRAETDSPVATPFFAYGIYNVNEKINVGLGVVTPFGSTITWGNEWQGRYALNELSLAAFVIQPTISYKVTEKFGIGGGLDIAFGSVSLRRSLPLEAENGDETYALLEGSTTPAVGFNIGAYYEVNDKISIGVDYRSKIDVTVEDGDATFAVPSLVQSQFEAEKFDATLPLPSVFSVGVGIKPIDKLQIAVEWALTGWDAYQELKFEYDAPVLGSLETSSDRHYQNSSVFKLGAEYMATESLALRGGIYYDQTAVEDGYITPETPDANTMGYTLGLGYTVGDKFTVDVHYLLVDKAERENVAALNSGGVDGTFKANANIFGFGLSYKFGGSSKASE
ncbi:long-chain fatty acid transport protein [Bernardetia litoralis DSM 6794]|uniref:Long-chain fatty acid transport protein n=1 Tax=Bernardetia litoralis (strain ATCC 23117 / DSM 6794 / NBRC 15988 / NCIMB 1366 / Fx l1 / Sio-4) TaxID=880071 RepID=I4AI79_BERLS|nr:outer membrane protein transport protein [Bernardetia litoralis]AFM03664.1 long-chain fatty acid transport protein [Bernardetia litoralis DSM 6794]